MSEDLDIAKLVEQRERIAKNLLAQIEKSKGEVQRLSNVLKTEILLKEAQHIFQTVQKLGYSYNF